MSILYCRHKGLEELYTRGNTRKIGTKFYKNILKIMSFLDAIADIEDCVGVKNFHELCGDRKGTYSMHVNGNYCITYRWDGKNVYELDFEDYH